MKELIHNLHYRLHDLYYRHKGSVYAAFDLEFEVEETDSPLFLQLNFYCGDIVKNWIIFVDTKEKEHKYTYYQLITDVTVNLDIIVYDAQLILSELINQFNFNIPKFDKQELKEIPQINYDDIQLLKDKCKKLKDKLLNITDRTIILENITADHETRISNLTSEVNRIAGVISVMGAAVYQIEMQLQMLTAAVEGLIGVITEIEVELEGVKDRVADLEKGEGIRALSVDKLTSGRLRNECNINVNDNGSIRTDINYHDGITEYDKETKGYYVVIGNPDENNRFYVVDRKTKEIRSALTEDGEVAGSTFSIKTDDGFIPLMKVDNLQSGKLNKDVNFIITECKEDDKLKSRLTLTEKNALSHRIYDDYDNYEEAVSIGKCNTNNYFHVYDVENRENGVPKLNGGISRSGTIRATRFLLRNNDGNFTPFLSFDNIKSGSLVKNESVAVLNICTQDNDKDVIQCTTQAGYDIGLTHTIFKNDIPFDVVTIGHSDYNNQFAVYDFEGLYGKDQNYPAKIAEIGRDGVVQARRFRIYNSANNTYEEIDFTPLLSGIPFHMLRSGRIADGQYFLLTPDFRLDGYGIEQSDNHGTVVRIGNPEINNQFLVKDVQTGELLGGVNNDGLVYARALHVRDPNGHDWITLDQIPIKPEQIIDGDLKTANIYAKKYFIESDKGWREFKECQCDGDNPRNPQQIAINDVQDGNIEHKYAFYEKQIHTPQHILEFHANISKEGIKETFTDTHDGAIGLPIDDVRIGDKDKSNQFVIRNKKTGEVETAFVESGDSATRSLAIVNRGSNQPSASIDNDGNIVCRSINTTEEGGGDTRYNKHPVFHKVRVVPEEKDDNNENLDYKEVLITNRAIDCDYLLTKRLKSESVSTKFLTVEQNAIFEGSIMPRFVHTDMLFTKRIEFVNVKDTDKGNKDHFYIDADKERFNIDFAPISGDIKTILSIEKKNHDDEDFALKFYDNIIANKDGIVGSKPGEGDGNYPKHAQFFSIKIINPKGNANFGLIDHLNASFPSLTIRNPYSDAILSEIDAQGKTRTSAFVIRDFINNQDIGTIDKTGVRFRLLDPTKEGEFAIRDKNRSNSAFRVFKYTSSTRSVYPILEMSNEKPEGVFFHVGYNELKFRGHVIANKDGIIKEELTKDPVFNTTTIVQKGNNDKLLSPYALEILDKDNINVADIGFDGTINAKKIKADEIIGEKRTFDKTRTKELEILEKIFTSNKKIEINQEKINVGNIDIKHEGHYKGSIHIRDSGDKGVILNTENIILRKNSSSETFVDDIAIINQNSISFAEQAANIYDDGERAYLGKDKLAIDKRVSFGMARSPSETLKITAIPVSGSNKYEKVDLLNVKIHRWTQEMCPSLTLYNLKAELFDRKKTVVTELFKVDYETIKFWGNTIADKDGIHISKAKDLIVDDKLRLNQNNNTFFQADRDKVVYNNINNNELFKVDKNYLSFNGNKIADSEGIISPLSCIKCEILEEKVKNLESKLQEQSEQITSILNILSTT